jgi:hypothetical protein
VRLDDESDQLQITAFENATKIYPFATDTAVPGLPLGSRGHHAFGLARGAREPCVVEVDAEATTRAGRGSRRLIGGIGALVVVALLGIAVGNGFRTFGIGIDTSPRRTSGARTLPVAGRCDAAVKTAWSSDSKKTPLWAVTVGTNMMGYTPAFGSAVKYVLLGKDEVIPASLCRGEARHRLLVSGWLLAGAAIAGVLTLMVVRKGRRHPAGQQLAP